MVESSNDRRAKVSVTLWGRYVDQIVDFMNKYTKGPAVVAIQWYIDEFRGFGDNLQPAELIKSPFNGNSSSSIVSASPYDDPFSSMNVTSISDLLLANDESSHWIAAKNSNDQLQTIEEFDRFLGNPFVFKVAIKLTSWNPTSSFIVQKMSSDQALIEKLTKDTKQDADLASVDDNITPEHTKSFPLSNELEGRCSSFNEETTNLEYLNIDLPTYECEFCGALFWYEECINKNGERLKFSQLYIYDIDNEISNRMRVASIQISQRSSAASNRDNLRLKLTKKRNTDARVYNLPTTDEITALIVRSFDIHNGQRDIIVEKTSELSRGQSTSSNLGKMIVLPSSFTGRESKGHDKVIAAICNSTSNGSNEENIDEIKMYYDCIYISPCEAVWRIFGFDINTREPSIERLPFHLPNEQGVVFAYGNSIDAIVFNATMKQTKVMAWFETNKRYPKARSLTSFTCGKEGKEKKERRRGVYCVFCLDTRFASVIVIHKRFKQIRCGLQAMVINDKWTEYKDDDVKKDDFVKEKILSDRFWNKIDYILSFTKPIYDMLRYCDTDKPTLHLDVESSFYNVVYNILIDRCTESCTPLHCLAHSLNPRNWSSYSFIHSMRRNKITHKRAEDLVFVPTNLRLLSRQSSNYKEGETKMWDIGGDRWEHFDGLGTLEVASLSLDELELEADLLVADGGENDEIPIVEV
ncbi:DUF659 domain-containing protein [Senna tora]|uniref:DUF659 domain-containing protein n=1 Tax=Senna tora TaxID=362788 RepID=A0A835C874_9FABA|nr:DUF659 domain-containing protein [Senna tora]